MSLTSYRAAPPRVMCVSGPGLEFPRSGWAGPVAELGGLAGPGGDLLFHALRRSTIGAEGFHGRVRDGIGCFAPRYDHQASQTAVRPGSRAPNRRSNGAPGLDPEASGREVSCVRVLSEDLPASGPRLAPGDSLGQRH